MFDSCKKKENRSQKIRRNALHELKCLKFKTRKEQPYIHNA
jgi:hypothetical protein